MQAEIIPITEGAIERLMTRLEFILSVDSHKNHLLAGELLIKEQMLAYFQGVNILELIEPKHRPILMQCVAEFLSFKQKQEGEIWAWQI